MRDYHGETVTTYAKMAEVVEDFFKPSSYGLLIVVGSPGTGKSQMFERAAGDRVLFAEGKQSPLNFYIALYEHLDRPVVLDDVDAALGGGGSGGGRASRDWITLLKTLCQTDKAKRVAWGTRSKELDDEEGVPRAFETRSRLCIICNDIGTVNKNLAAVLDRGYVVEFRPTALEVHEQVQTWFTDKEIIAFVADHLDIIARPSFRDYIIASQRKKLGRDWQTTLLHRWCADEKLVAYVRTIRDSRLKTSTAREKKFAELGGGSRATYMRAQSRYRELIGNPEE